MRRLSFLAVLVLALMLVGCASVPAPSYIGAHRKTHDAYKRIVDTFARQNPADAEAAKDLYESEEILIRRAESGIYPTPVTPAMVPTGIK